MKFSLKNKGGSRSNIDPSVRFNLSVSDRVSAFPKEFLEDTHYLENLFEQKKLAENVRDNMSKSLAVLVSILFLAINGSDLKLPSYLINISEIPSVIEILVCLCSFSFVVTAIKFHDVNTYEGVIDNVLTHKFGDDMLSKHIYKMAHSNESSIFMTLVNKYLNGYNETFQRGRRAKFFANLLLFLLITILILFLIMPAALIVFVSFVILPKTLMGWIIISFSSVCVLFSILTLFMVIVGLPHDIIVKDVPEVN